MHLPGGERQDLTRRHRAALRALLIGATAAAGRTSDRSPLRHLVVAAPIDALPAAAALHRVGGTVLRGLDGVAEVPADVRRRLGVLGERATLNHLLATATLGDVGRAFDAADLSWLVMKGPAVAALLYPEPGDRSYNDLDLLIDRRDFPRAVRVLEELGFRHHIHNWALAEEMLAGEIQMSNASVVIDLHWHLHYSPRDRRPFAIDPEAMIERSRRVRISGVEAPTLDPVDTLLTLAFHAARSDGHRLIWFKDIERAVATSDQDWDELRRRSRASRCGPPVGLMLERSRRLLGADVPPEITRAMVPRSLLLTDRLSSVIAHPVQLHERRTITRGLTRSVRSSSLASMAAGPERAARRLRRKLFPPAINETDDPDEKASYLKAVARSVDR
jgi:hypothetical protein